MNLNTIVMKIVICGSIDFTPKIKEIAGLLTKNGYKVEIPFTSQRIINGELTLKNFKREKKENGDGAFRKSVLRKIKNDVIKDYYNKIKKADAILVLNLKKRGILNYIGGNVFLEIGFAHVLGKKIFFLNEIPEMIYTDELQAMQPIILDGNLDKIK